LTRLGFEAAVSVSAPRTVRSARTADGTRRHEPRRETRLATPRTAFNRFIARVGALTNRAAEKRSGSLSSPRFAARITFLTFRAAHLQDSSRSRHREVPLKTPRLRKAEPRPPAADRERGSHPRLPGDARDARAFFCESGALARTKDDPARGSRRARGLVRDHARGLETGEPAKKDTR